MKITFFFQIAILFLLLLSSCFGPFNPNDPNMGLSSDTTNTPTITTTELLVAWWQCDDSGTLILSNSAVDSLRNTGALYQVAFDAGIDKYGYSLSFKNQYSKATVIDNSTLNFGLGDFTISLWCKPSSLDTSNEFTLLSKGLADSVGSYSLAISHKKFAVTIGNQTYLSTSSKDTLSVNTWNHLVVTRKEAQLTLYSNNVTYTPQTYDIHSITNYQHLLLGINAQGEKNFIGNLDEIKIYRKAWNTVDVSQEFNKYQ